MLSMLKQRSRDSKLNLHEFNNSNTINHNNNNIISNPNDIDYRADEQSVNQMELNENFFLTTASTKTKTKTNTNTGNTNSNENKDNA
jgi:hypothetical protein